jgi:act minimal PKS chain-length factor (CLF/KS beta)
MLVMEDAVAARARGSRHVYGEVAGYGSTFDPPPGSDRPPRLRAAIELALADAEVTPQDVDVVFADGHGVPELDARESGAIADVFGPYAVPVTVPKTMTGRLYAGAATDIAAALLAIRDGVVPPTVAVRRVAPVHRIDLVLGQPREQRVGTALVLARGHGGFNSALVLRNGSTT